MGKILDSLREQLSFSKWYLKDKWNQGADEGKRMKEKQKNILKRNKEKEDESKS